MFPVVQVAIDVVDLDRALEIAEEAVRGGVDWIEVGTPLIKSEGMRAVREFRKRFPKKTIVADLKTMDTGALEVEMAARSGADVVIVMGAAHDSTIEEAVRAARRYGCKIMVDLMGIEDIEKRAFRVQELGVDYILVHVGIDAQMLGMTPLEFLKRLSGEIEIPIAVAGGLDAEKAAEAVLGGASIIIVGGAITRAANVEEAARKVVEAVRMAAKGKIVSREGKERTVLDILSEVSSANVSDALHRKGAMSGIKAIVPGKIVGRAITVKTAPGDWAKVVEAIEIADKESVIVVDAGGAEIAVWGELASLSAKNKGVRGVIIDGAVRDVDEIREIGFPVYARYVSPQAGEPKGFGEINVEIVCGGITVRPGDYIIADEDGVVVIPKERALEVANRALQVKKAEDRIREEIRRGRILSQVLSLDKWEKVVIGR